MYATAQTSGGYLFFRACATAQPSMRFLILSRVYATGCTDLREVPLYLFKVYAAAQTSIVIDLNCRDLKKVPRRLSSFSECVQLFEGSSSSISECVTVKKVPLLFESVCSCLKEVPLLFQCVCNCLFILSRVCATV